MIPGVMGIQAHKQIIVRLRGKNHDEDSKSYNGKAKMRV